MERYAKYREQIKRMPPEQFTTFKPKKKELEEAGEAQPAEVSFSYGAKETPSKEKSKSGPYSLYLKKRKHWFWIKVGCFVIVVGLFILWWFLLQGRQ